MLFRSEQRARIAALANDFPRLWRDRNTPDRERKRMVRLLIEDVTLIKECQITLHVRFKGGATQSLTLPPPLSAWELRMTPAATTIEFNLRKDLDATLRPYLRRGVERGSVMTGGHYANCLPQKDRRFARGAQANALGVLIAPVPAAVPPPPATEPSSRNSCRRAPNLVQSSSNGSP